MSVSKSKQIVNMKKVFHFSHALKSVSASRSVVISLILVVALAAGAVGVTTGTALAANSSHKWNYDYPEEYTYNPGEIEVSEGTAHSVRLPLEAGYWSNRYDHRSVFDQGRGVSCDREGNPAVVGTIQDGTTYKSWVRKFDGSNGSVLWTDIYGISDETSANYCFGTSITHDAQGNIIAAGFTIQNIIGLSPRIIWRAWARKYSTDGRVLWTKLHEIPGNAVIVNGVTCGPDNNPVVSGTLTSGDALPRSRA